jgi:hypothetical protein
MSAVRVEITVLAECMVAAADRWATAHEAWQAALRVRAREVARAERRLVDATGGLGLRRWESACRRRRIITVADAQLRSRAVRVRPAVAAALAERDRVVVHTDAAAASARAELAVRSARLLSYGRLGVSLSGVSAGELAQLAHSGA